MTNTEHQSPEDIAPIQFLGMDHFKELPAPLVRVTTCGLLSFAIIREIMPTDPPQARYQVFTPEHLHGRGPAPALMLLKLLVSRPQRFALRDWLMQQFCHEREVFSNVRLDNIASQLRSLLCPHAYEGLRTRLVAHARSRSESGDGFQLASYPLIWIDHEALAWNVEQAARMERFGDDPLPFWERAYALSKGGEYLPDESYSDWAFQRREEVAGMRKQCVRALARLYQERQGKAGEEEALLLLRSYWHEHPREEDVLRPLMELLARHDCYQEALEAYEQLCTLLQREKGQPTKQTQDVMEFVRNKQIQHTSEGTTQRETKPPSSFSFSDQGKDSLLIPFSFVHTHAIIPETPLAFGGPEQHTGVAAKKPLPPVPDNAPNLFGQTFGTSPDDERGYGLLVTSSGEQEQQTIRLTSEQLDTLQIVLGESTMASFDQSKRETLRRIAIAIGAAGANSLIDPEPWERLFTAQSKKQALNSTSLDLFERLIAEGWRLSNANELEAAEGIIASFLPKIQAILPSEINARIAFIASQSLRLQSILMHHHFRIKDKMHLCQESVEYARYAHDANTLVTALLELATAYEFSGQMEQCFQTLQEALFYSPQASPLAQSRVYSNNAILLAISQRKKEAEFYIGLAHETFPDAPTVDPAYALADASVFTLSHHSGLVRLYCGQLAQAPQAFEFYKHHPSGANIPGRLHLEILNGLSKAAIQAGELERYTLLFETVLVGATRLGSKKRFAEAMSIFRGEVPQTWRTNRILKDLTEKYQLERSFGTE